MTRQQELIFAIEYFKETGCDDFYSRNTHYKVVKEGRRNVLIAKELSFGATEIRYEIK